MVAVLDDADQRDGFFVELVAAGLDRKSVV
jgi:hypothetical protein